MTDKSTKPGRLTLPIERGIDAEVRALVERLGADAVRNSDGTEHLPRSTLRTSLRVVMKSGPIRARASASTNTFPQTLIPPQKVGL